MKARLCITFVLLALCSPVANAVTCTVKCPNGYLGVCVEADGECTCRCAKDASAGGAAVAQILRSKDASQDAIERAVTAYKKMIRSHVTDFSFAVKDKGREFTINGGENRPHPRDEKGRSSATGGRAASPNR
jgi:hypothetical protein